MACEGMNACAHDHTLHHALYTIHHALSTIHRAPCTIHHTLSTIHLPPALSTMHCTHHTLYAILHAPVLSGWSPVGSSSYNTPYYTHQFCRDGLQLVLHHTIRHTTRTSSVGMVSSWFFIRFNSFSFTRLHSESGSRCSRFDWRFSTCDREPLNETVLWRAVE
jgi:hypothetical protein